MSFLNAGLLLGLGLISIPVVLHFLFKQKPKNLVFPAMKLLQQVQRQSVRRLRVKHLLLMLLRMLAIAIVVFAIARPSVPPANYSLSTWEIRTLLGLSSLGIGVFYILKHRLQQQIKNAHERDVKASQIRNWLTIGTLAAILMLVIWPYQRRISAEIVDPSPVTSNDLPVSGVFLFDNSMSMTYLQAGEDSLKKAQVIANAHIQSLPSGSRIAVGDVATDRPIPFQSTVSSAVSRINSLSPSSVALPLEDRLREAIKSHDDDRKRTLTDQSDLDENLRKDRYIRRVYIFTDLAKSAWRTAGSSLLKSDLEKFKFVNVYLVDVGQSGTRNQSLLNLNLSGERIPLGGELSVSATVLSQGQDISAQAVELYFEGKTGEQLKQGQVTVDLSANQSAEALFPLLSGINQRWINGEVELVGTDPLLFDNTRYFSVEVSDPPEILVLAPDQETAQVWMTALAPHDQKSASLNKFKPKFVRYDRIKELTLSDYPNITMINCPRMTDDAWFQLGKYVEDGGGLIVVTGSADIASENYNRAAAQKFLPAALDAWHPIGEWSFSVDSKNHPLFSIYRRLENFGSFSMFENLVYVTRFWMVTPAQGANVLSTYLSPEKFPAIIERSTGKGRTVLITTAASLPDNPNDRWNNLPSPVLEPWIFLAFVEQATEYVSRFGNVERSFVCGQTPIIRLPATDADRTFLLRQPDLKQIRVQLPANESILRFKELTSPGHYELTDPESRDILGSFSLNYSPEESDLTRMTSSDLDDRLGKDRYQVAENIEQLKDNINAADLGQEIYPLLLVLVVVLFCSEHLVANRFYDNPLEKQST
ncbi:BatA domain-containing protein [Planctomicrobium sp. SH668]|uniref:BatA domain-containing protein n=1 Tax=Planctomicrobium sp. SH668 TaxID=3448126 RepID=UPI003F5ADE54